MKMIKDKYRTKFIGSIIVKFILTVFLNHYVSILLLSQSNDTVAIEFQEWNIPGKQTELSDTIILTFNLTKINGDNKIRNMFISESDPLTVEIEEYIGNEKDFPPIIYFDESLKLLKRREMDTIEGAIPENITISLLVDHSGSISDDEFEKIQKAILAFVQKVPEGSLFYSWFSSDISASKLLTKDNFDEVTKRTVGKETALYNAIYTKLLEFDANAIIPNEDGEQEYKLNNELAERASMNNYLIVLTDGVNDVEKIPKYQTEDWEVIFKPKLNSKLRQYRDKVKVFALGFGENSDDFDEEDLKAICRANGNPNGYYLVTPDKVLEHFTVKLTDELSPDYEIKLKNPQDKTYQGKERRLVLTLKTENEYGFNIATGTLRYAKGATSFHYIVGKQSVWKIITKGLIFGIILFLVVVIIMQLIVPLIKNRIFYIRYAKKYKPPENELHKECPYCGDPINPKDIVITKCEHIVHKVCWNDFDHVCPEYGQNCNQGKQKFFDITDPFSKKNRIYYVKWVVFGLVGGFLTWFIYLLLKDINQEFDFAINVIKAINPDINKKDLDLFDDKISSLLLIGSTMGLFFTFFFSYIEDYRIKNIKVIGSIILRSLIGAVLGFFSFLVGGIILVLIEQPSSTLYFDWIPWIIFGSSIGLLLSFRTTIVWKHGLLGGIISIIFCFFILYLMAGDIDYSALLIAFMLFGGGLGISIATVHSRAENYYLKIVQGKKNEETIPVHKWMSYQGGHNEVYIGKAFSCEIQMNWESRNPEIAEKHVKMYLNQSNIPVIVSLENGKTTVYNDRFDMNTSKEYELYSGASFKIGNTVFQYFEKEK